jgi:hypothetical protein
MWSLDAPCPQFSVHTPSGPVVPRDLRRGWTVLLHCTRPCTPGRGIRLERFPRRRGRLAERGCVDWYEYAATSGSAAGASS